MKEKHLVLSGSGTLFPYFIGAIKRLEEEGIIFKSITGVSGGSLVGVMLACGLKACDMEKIVLSKSLHAFVDYSWNPLVGLGFLKGDEFYSFLKQVLPKTVTKMSDTMIPLTVVTTNLSKEYNTQRENYFTTKDTPDMDIIQAVRASISIPLLFKYQIIDGEIHIDGGVSNNFPINAIPESESKDIVGLKMDTSFASKRQFLVSNSWTYGLKSLFKSISILDIMLFKVTVENILKKIYLIPVNIIEYILAIVDTFMNTLEREHVKDAVYSKVIYLKSSTSSSYGLFNYTFSDIRDMIDTGYSETDEWLKINTI